MEAGAAATRAISVGSRAVSRAAKVANVIQKQQILDPCLLLASGLRDYEIKLDRRISAARESLQLFLFGN